MDSMLIFVQSHKKYYPKYHFRQLLSTHGWAVLWFLVCEACCHWMKWLAKLGVKAHGYLIFFFICNLWSNCLIKKNCKLDILFSIYHPVRKEYKAYSWSNKESSSKNGSHSKFLLVENLFKEKIIWGLESWGKESFGVVRCRSTCTTL